MIRPFPLEVTARDFALAAAQRRIAISLLAGTLNSAAAFSMAVDSPADVAYQNKVVTYDILFGIGPDPGHHRGRSQSSAPAWACSLCSTRGARHSPHSYIDLMMGRRGRQIMLQVNVAMISVPAGRC
jgi:hypothetical protein